MNENQKKNFKYVIGVFVTGVLAVLLVPIIFHLVS